jgi:sulfur relay (sulfurtransferase) DsrC/TusE family protein
MNFKIAIPSYRRSDNFIVQNLLKEAGIKDSDIYIFVSDNQDYTEYKKQFPKYNIVFEKELNDLKEKHNFIVDYFSENEHVVIIEDDIKEIVKKKGKKVEKFIDLQKLFQIGFNECQKNNCKLWGISPTDNGFYMSDSFGKCFKVVAGYIFGIIVDKRIKVNISQKHDYERTILNKIYFGGVIRFDMFGQRSNSFTNKGGLQEIFTSDERMKEELKVNNFLVKTYPKHVAKKNRHNKVLGASTELRLLRI